MHNVDLGRLIQRLINHTIPLGQPEQRSQLLFARVCVQVEMQANPLEADSNIFGYSQSAAKVEIALSANSCHSQLDVQRSKPLRAK